jgi:dTDP-glucose pyrophosphorylase
MDWKTILVEKRHTVKEVLKKMDIGGEKILFVVDKANILIGVITDGDIRRYILEDGSLENSISGLYNTNPVCLNAGSYTSEDAKRIMVEKKVEALPVIDRKGRITGALSWTDLYGEKKSVSKKEISIPVVIMAGGHGKRMDPFTKILPKPLIPLGDNTILELIMEKFQHYGVKHFYITLNYKGEMVKTYLENVPRKYKIDYIWEKEFLGTAGSLKLLPPNIKNDLIVSNCDTIIEADYNDILKFHIKNGNLLTVVGSIQHYSIPYGIINFKKEGRIKSIQEKPELDFTVNTGMYILSKEAIKFIPGNKPFDMTDLIQVLLKKKKKIGVYPISQKSYIDIGQWEEYKKYFEKFLI